MSPVELCDVVYALLVDDVAADVRVAQQAALTARMFGASVEVPTVDQAVADLDVILNEMPKQMSDEQRELRRVLGVR